MSKTWRRKEKKRTGAPRAWPSASGSGKALAILAVIYGNHVGSGQEVGGNLRTVAGTNDNVVVFARTQPFEDWSRLLRCDQSKIVQETKDIGGGLKAGCNEGNFNIFVVKMPGQRSRQPNGSLVDGGLQNPRRRIVENDAQAALILAAVFAHFERAGAGGGFPIDMAGGIFGHVIADAMQIVAASAHKACEFAGQVHTARLGQERERETRGQAEVLIAIAPACRKSYLEVGTQFLLRREKRKINRLPEERPVGLLIDTAQAAIGQAQPLLFRCA